MKSFIFSIFIFCFSFNHFAQTLDYQWHISPVGTKAEHVKDFTMDAFQNLIICGNFSGQCNFKTGEEDVILDAGNIGNSSFDTYVAKYDLGKNLIWVKSFGFQENQSEQLKSVATDADGNVFVAGLFQNSIDLDPGSEEYIVTATSNSDGFIVKLNAGGEFQWGFNLGGSEQFSELFGIDTDEQGNLIVSGFFRGTIDFQPGPESLTLTSLSFTNPYLAKYSPNGVCLWAKQFEKANSRSFIFNSILVDNENNILMGGYFDGTLDFDAGVDEFNLSSVNTSFDAILVKYSPEGNFIWAFTYGSINLDAIDDIAVDEENNIYITGQFRGTVDFDPGPGTANFTSLATNMGSNAMNFTKYDKNGNYIWNKIFGSTNSSLNENKLHLSANNNFYILGNFRGTIDLDPSSEVNNISSPGDGLEYYVVKYDIDGNYIQSFTFGNNGLTFAKNVGNLSTDNQENLYIAISSFSPIYLNPNTPQTNVNSTQNDLFLVKYGKEETSTQINISEKSTGVLNVYPNPCANYLQIYCTFKANEQSQLKLTDISGKLIYSKIVNLSNSIEEIDLSSFDNGLYTLSVRTNEKFEAKKIIIAK